MMITREQFKEIQRRMEAGEFDTSDIHTATAAYVFGVPSNNVTRDQRDAAKQANYIHLYSGGS